MTHQDEIARALLGDIHDVRDWDKLDDLPRRVERAIEAASRQGVKMGTDAALAPLEGRPQPDYNAQVEAIWSAALSALRQAP